MVISYFYVVGIISNLTNILLKFYACNLDITTTKSPELLKNAKEKRITI